MDRMDREGEGENEKGEEGSKVDSKRSISLSFFFQVHQVGRCQEP